MEKWKALILTLLFTGIICIAGAAVAAEKPSPLDKASLNLTAEQSEKIQTLRENRWHDLKPLRNLLISKFTELKALLSHNNPEQKGLLKEKQSEILDIQGRIRGKMASYRMELRKILTKEQQDQLPAYGLERGYFRGIKSAELYDKTMVPTAVIN